MSRTSRAILAAALLLRIAAVALPGPYLSDDVRRHLWDGRVGAAGTSPYAHAPADPATAPFRDADVWPRVNHPEHRTIYGPAAQVFATTAASLGATTPRAYRAAALAVEVPVLLLAAFRLPPALLALWALHPLVVWEGGVEGHVDLLAGALLLAALVLARRADSAGAAATVPVAAGALFAAAGLVKYWPLVFAGLVAPRRARGAFFAGAAGAALLLFAPYASSGRTVFESLSVYQRHWDFNGSLHVLLGVDDWTADKAVARTAVAAGAIVLGYAARSAAVGAGAFFLTAPTVYPWYLVGLLPFALLEERYPAVRRALLVWTVTVLAAHAVHLRSPGAPWEPSDLARAIEYLPVLAVLAGSAVRAVVRRGRSLAGRPVESSWAPAA